MHDEYILARKIAQKHLAVRKIQGATNIQLGECTEVFYWSDKHALFEFPFVSNTGIPAGYLICSGNREIPAVLEYANEGPPLSHFLRARLWQVMTAEKLVPKALIFYYLNPFEYAVVSQAADRTFAMHSSNFTLQKLDMFKGITRTPEVLWNKASVSASFDEFEDERNAAQATTRVLRDFQPVKYMQTTDDSVGSGAPYSSERESHSEKDNSSARTCHAGCIPVAWAMLASSFRRGNFKAKGDKIFGRAPGWDIDWYWTADGDVGALCKKVNRFIWDAHRICNTKCSGYSLWKDAIFGERLFWGYGLNWGFVHDNNVTWGDVIAPINNRNPRTLILGAEFDWHSLYPSQSNVDDPEDGNGHAVCMYGYRSSGMVYVCLGWGRDRTDKYARFDALEKKHTLKYVGERNHATDKKTVASSEERD